MPTIGFFGLGTMGYAMAARLAGAGLPVAVADKDEALLARWRGEHPAATHAPDAAEVVISCVTDEPAARSLLLGDGLLSRASAGQLFIDHTTTSPAFAREADALAAERGAAFIDAPVSGGAAGAKDGSLSVMAGGEDEAVRLASTVLKHYAARITPLGASGAGQVGKLCNQVAIAGIVRGLAEAVALARAAHLDEAALLDALAVGTARSNQLEQHRDKLLDAKQGFATTFEWLDKDLAHALDEAAAHRAPLPMAKLVKDMLGRKPVEPVGLARRKPN